MLYESSEIMELVCNETFHIYEYTYTILFLYFEVTRQISRVPLCWTFW